ncbi:uncharacterized protein LOC134804330 [Cydia splendana]|uniref:uncharacterized protein LOC134804330 n=1 Tax=Cydia splendana TaxID=1100963 RepID=UPI00300DA8B5
MDSILPPPPPFSFVNSLENVTTGNLSKEWEKWKNAFLIYYEACELTKKDKKVQLSILLHVIGEQCREVYEQFDKSTITTSTELLAKFDSFFLPKKNLTIERHRFFTRDQKEGESIEQYSFELKKLASSCEFKDLMETLIRDRLICGIKDQAIRERLLREPDLTLKKSLDICNVAQISKVQAGAIKKESVEHHAYAVQRDYFGHHGVVQETACEDNSDISDVNRVMWVSRRGASAHRGATRAWPRGSRQLSRPRAPPAHPPAPAPVQRWGPPMQRNQLTHKHGRGSERSAWCSMCGYEHGNSRCPAAGKRCLNCNRFDHFSRMCTVYEIQADDSTDQVRVIYYLSDSQNDWSVDLTINDSKLKFKLDTGADVNIIPRTCLRDLGIAERELGMSLVRLKGYSGTGIKIVGQCHLKVQHKDRSYIVDFIIADVDSPPVLGILIRNRRHLICDSDNRSDSESESPVCLLPYDDLDIPTDNAAMTSPSNASLMQRSDNCTASDSRPAPASNDNNANNNLYITRSGRTVIPPDRWGY